MADYVKDIYGTFLTSTEQELKNAVKKLKDMSPEPMDSMLEKQPKTQEIAKHKERKSMITQDVPPTTPGTNANNSQKTNLSNAMRNEQTSCQTKTIVQ